MFTTEVNTPFTRFGGAASTVGAMRMRPIDRVLLLARDRDMDQTALAAAMGVQPQHITNWKRRGLPPAQLPLAAQVLRCSVDFLLGHEAPGVVLNPLEQQLVRFFRGMSEEHRNDLLALANRWYSAAHPNDGAADPFSAKRKVKS